MSYTDICPTCLARQGAPAGGKLISQEIGGCMACRQLEVVFVYRVGEEETGVGLQHQRIVMAYNGNG